jgi:hypothetical protein
MTIYSELPPPMEVSMAPRKLTAEEKRWRAESDAHTLAAAEEIANNKARLNAAKKEARRMAQAAIDQANKYVKVTKTPTAKKRPKPKPKAKARPRRRTTKR